jgi:RND family efflux transporter MFP subunit
MGVLIPLSLLRRARMVRIGGISLLGAFLFSACDKKANPPAAPAIPPPPVTVSKPVEKVVRDWDEYTGHLQSPETANVSARVSGLIEKAPFKEGALVKKGDELFKLDDRPFKADLDNKVATVQKDEAAVALAKADAARSEELLAKKAVSKQEVDTNNARQQQAEAQLAADKAQVETAQLALDWTRVTAPISGRVSRMYVTVGNQVNGGSGQSTLLTTIVSVDPIYCYVPIPERSYLRYQEYAAHERHSTLREAKIACYIQLENEKGFPHEGMIDFIDNSVDTATGTIQVRGVFANPTGTLTPGVFARMRINRSDPYKTLLVPDVAIGTEQNERYVLVVGKDNVVVSKPVKLGGLFGSLRSITSGLDPNDAVVVNGLQQAQPNSKVAPETKPISPEALKELEVAVEPGAAVGKDNQPSASAQPASPKSAQP